jgi:hypothetical protein
MVRPLVILRAFVLFWAIAPSVAIPGEIEPIQYQSIGGTLSILHVNEQGEERFTLTLGEAIILDTKKWWSVGVREALPKVGPHKIFVLELGTGGTACDGYNQVLEVLSPTSWVLTKSFGNCNDPTITVRNNRIDFAFPPTASDDGERWKYQAKRLSRLK